MEPVGISDSSDFELSIQLKAVREALKATNILDANHFQNKNTSESSLSNEDKIKSDTSLDICDCFTRMLTEYNQDEVAIKRILQLIYQVIKPFSEKNSSYASNTLLTSKWAELLVDLTYSSVWNKTLISDALLCLRLYTRHLGGSGIVCRLWHKFLLNNAKNENISLASMHVLIQFFDEFTANVKDFKSNCVVEQFVYKLLLCEEREERKAALYLMKKMNVHADVQLKDFWVSYITILENLEENQSHLILPSLESFKHNNIKNVNLQMWVDALYIKILSHQNILVIRWALEYILESFTCVQISEKTLLQFIKASNNTSLYNHEGYFIPSKDIPKFLSSDINRFMVIMTEVNIKCIPMHFWLTHIHMCESISVAYSYELILKIAAKIRPLQNPFIRAKSIELFEKIFQESIRSMRLSEYVVLIESLYNITDPFIHFHTFYHKLINCLYNGDKVSLTQRFYEIITNNLSNELHPHLEYMPEADCNEERSNKTQTEILNKIADYLINQNKLGKEDLIWILLMLVFESKNSEVVRNICEAFWDLPLDEFSGKSFEELTDNIISKLSNGSDTLTFVRKKATGFFVQEYLTSFSDLCNYKVTAEDILALGTHKTLLKLSQLLANNKYKVETSIINTFLIVLKRYTRMSTLCYIVAENVLKYLKNFYSSWELLNYVNQILCTDLGNVGICAAVLNSGVVLEKETYIRGIIVGETNFGDARTEELYLLKLDKRQSSRLHQIRHMYALSVPVDLIKVITNNLLSMHKALSAKKPRYFEHSTEHRLKMRIAKAVISKLQLSIELCEDDVLNTLLNYNNQLNINYMYEFLVAKCVSKIEPILQKLDEVTKYTPSQQVSLISIIHCYCILNFSMLSKKYLDNIINKLLPLTMGAQFQTRLYAQLIIYKIFVECKARSNEDILKSHDVNLQEAIALAVGPQIKELLNDARLLLPHIYLNNPANFYDIVMFITSAPSDEYSSNLDYSKYVESKRLFSKKKSAFAKETPTPEQVDISCINWNNLQRKMNPESELLEMTSFAQPEKSTECEMFIVASLIDKIPNLGGIARTCEVLGIKNLVLSSRKLVEKEDFKSLSMTAEKNLNVIEVRPSNLQEFFKEKQADGFKVLGAEQTVDSVNIIGFEFPRKCVLVLGHEKEGIPSNILGFLDKTIEIPQFGLLRSLNVHVTGAMFMWEYCKQHVVKSTSANILSNPTMP